jgi:hypothetical protein
LQTGWRTGSETDPWFSLKARKSANVCRNPLITGRG